MGRITLSQDIYDRLRADIRNGKLEPDMPLRMEELKARYRIGATPLREALNRLSTESLVSVHGNRGFRVAPISLHDFDEIVALREYLEMTALFKSIENGDDDWESNIVVTLHNMLKLTMLDVGTDMEVLEEREDRHRRFHLALIGACNSSWLLKLWTMLTEHEERYRRIAMSGAAVTKTTSVAIDREHRRLRDAALARDPELCWKLLAPHRQRTVAAVHKLFVSR